MNKILKFLAIFIVAACVAAGAVSAVQLAENDFNGEFKALAPVNVDFMELNGDGYSGYIDADNNLVYLIFEDENIDDDSIDTFYGVLEDEGFKKVGTDGDLTLFKLTNSSMGSDGVGTYTDGKLVIITGENMKELKKIGKSVEFE